MTVTSKAIDFSEFDLVIIGGGCAGLSLTLALLQYNYAGKVLVIERREQYEHDRTWSGWFSQSDLALLTNLSMQTFPGWSISDGRQCYCHTSTSHPYYSISSEHFYSYAIQKIHASSNVQLLTGAALSVNDLSAITHSHIIDTVGLGIEITRPRYGLWQSFVGVMVSSSSVLFDVNTQSHATLMSDMSQDENGFYFTYIIPQNPHQALVEVTYFTSKSLTRDYLTERSTHAAQRLVQTKITPSLNDITITAIEYGHLPMWDVVSHQTPRSQTHHHITLAGNISGALRSSSGYGFATIQRWANQTGKALSHTDKLSTKPLLHTRHYSRWVQWMDNILLVVLVRYPKLSSTIFLRMANRLTGSEFAQFMSHRAPLRIWLKVIMAMPKWAFIKAVWWSWLD